MRDEQDRPSPESLQEVRQIRKWTRRYTQNRTLPVVLAHLAFIVGGLVLGGVGCLAGLAYVRGRSGWAAVLAVLLGALIIALAWLCRSLAPRAIASASRSMYRGEGEVTGTAWLWEEGDKPPMAAMGVLLLFVVVQLTLHLLGFLPDKYLQPIAAVYVVPTMIWLGLTRRPEIKTAFMFLWPLLYAVHAVLIALGVPISRGLIFDIYFPLLGYGLVAALAGHVYSRYALRQLKRLAASGDSSKEES
jgi:hypothetical protein